MTERVKTPMEENYPTICEWVRHGAVNTEHLRKELLKALSMLGSRRVALVWINDRVGYQCPACKLYVCIPARAVAFCPDCY